MRVRTVGTALIVAISLCACSTGAPQATTSSRVEPTGVWTQLLSPSGPSQWAPDEAFITSLTTLTTTGHFDVLAAASVPSRSVRATMLGGVVGLCDDMRPPLTGDASSADQFALVLTACGDVRALRAAVAARDDATFAESYAGYLAHFAALDSLDAGASDDTDSYEGDADDGSDLYDDYDGSDLYDDPGP